MRSLPSQSGAALVVDISLRGQLCYGCLVHSLDLGRL